MIHCWFSLNVHSLTQKMLSTSPQKPLISTNDQGRKKRWVENRTDTESHLNYNMPPKRGYFTQCIKTQSFKQEERRKRGRISNRSVQTFFQQTFLPPLLVEKKTIMWEVYILIKPAGRWLTKGSMVSQYILRIILIQHHRTWKLPTICFSWL